MRYQFHGYMVEAQKLTVHDKDGVTYEFNSDGQFFKRTTTGDEVYVPGDFLVSTLDGASVRVRKAEDFLLFAKEVAVEPEKESGNGSEPRGLRDDVSQSGVQPGGDAGGAGGNPDGPEAVGGAKDSRGRGASQRRARPPAKNARGRVAQSQKARKVHARHRARKGRRVE